MKPRYLHIGYPKCASTALQRCFFEKHPELSHLGISQNPPFFNDGIRLMLEHDIRTHRVSSYDANRAKLIFKNAFDYCEQDDRTKVVGISHERLGFSMSDDVDPSIKAERLHGIMGDNTRVLIVIRRQDQWLISMYKQMIFMGMSYDWYDFLDWIWRSKHQIFYADLNYIKIISTYRNLFGHENVMVVTQEMIKRHPTPFLISLQEFIGVKAMLRKLPIRWKSPDLRVIEATRRLNMRHPNGINAFGNQPSLQYRYADLCDKKSGMNLDAYLNAKIIHHISQVSDKHAIRKDAPELQFQPHPEITNAARDEFIEWNKNLEKEVRLPLRQLGYLNPDADWFEATS